MKTEKGYFSFCKFINQKKVSLIGAGVSNFPLIPFLYECGASLVILRDLKKKADDPAVLKGKDLGAKVILGVDYLEDLNEDIIIRSPGIRPDHPKFLQAVKNGAYLTCETELFLRFVPCLSIGITGSDGKTTTTTLISEILKESGYRVHLGGNIGKAMLPQLKEIEGENSVSVSELSSFQLMNCRFSPDIAVITNLSENHLDWHRDMSEYLDSKKNIYNNQSCEGVTVLNADNLYTAGCSPMGSVRRFSSRDFVNNGCFLKDKTIYLAENGKATPILSTDDILIPGHHNVENYMTAIAATTGLAKKDAVLTVARTFGGVPHRIQRIRTLDGITYYNSSIDSSPARSTATLRSFGKPLVMIAGGYDKKLDYTPLGDVICEHVKVLILCGDTSKKIKEAVENSKYYTSDKIKIIMAKKFDETVSLARKYANYGDDVILSPASASFDLFQNFEERGYRFVQLVKELS